MAKFWESAPEVDADGGSGKAAGGGSPTAAGRFWDSSPVVDEMDQGKAVSIAPNLTSLPLVGPIAGAMGLDGRVSVADAPTGTGAQERYDAAMGKVRQSLYADMSDEDWERFATGKGRSTEPNMLHNVPLLGPITDMAQKLTGDRGAFSPYDATQLSQHGAMFGLTDEMGAGLGAFRAGIDRLLGGQGPQIGEAFNALLELEQARRDLGRDKEGALGLLAETVGGLASGGAAVKGAAALGSQGNRITQTLKSYGGAAASGAAYGAGATDGDIADRAAGAATGAAASTLVATAAPIVFRGGQRLVRGLDQATVARQAVRSAPKAATIKAGAKASYDAAEATGAIVDGRALKLLDHDVRQMLAAEGLLMPKTGALMGGYPKAKAALKALRQYTDAGSLSVPQAKTLNRMFRKVANSTDPEESRIGVILINGLDDFLDSLPIQAFSRGQGLDAVKHWRAGKDQYARFKRTAAIEDAAYRARFSPDGFANGLRAEFKKILTQPKKRRGFSPEEILAMERFAEGGAVEDLLAHISDGGSLTAGLAGHLVGGPVAGAAMAGAKFVAGKAANRALDRGARRAAGQIRAEVALPAGIPRIQSRRDPVTEALLSRAAARGGNPALEEPRAAVTAALMKRREPLWTGG